MTRMEADSLGTLEIPSNVLWGAQTARALENFAIPGPTIGQFPELVRAFAHVKEAAATANVKLGVLTHEKGQLIKQACAELREGQHQRQFPIAIIQGGAGTSTNMNVNEVIANRGLEISGHVHGDYVHLHPNDDVNRSQSTNDIYPTAIRLALLLAMPKFRLALSDLSSSFARKASEFENVPKVGRTQLQDAVPMSLGQEFGAFASALDDEMRNLDHACDALREINLGGTAIGTGVAAPTVREPAR